MLNCLFNSRTACEQCIPRSFRACNGRTALLDVSGLTTRRRCCIASQLPSNTRTRAHIVQVPLLFRDKPVCRSSRTAGQDMFDRLCTLPKHPPAVHGRQSRRAGIGYKHDGAAVPQEFHSANGSAIGAAPPTQAAVHSSIQTSDEKKGMQTCRLQQEAFTSSSGSGT